MAEHVTRPTDDADDDDLELLRIAALKSINAKKDQVTQRSPPSRTTGAASATTAHPIQATSKSYSTIPVKQSRNPATSGAGHENINLLTVTSQSYYKNLPIQQPRTVAPAIDSFSARQRLEQLDINEPYVPQRVPPLPVNGQPPNLGSNGGWLPEPATMGASTYPSYIQPKVGETLPVGVNVQLSPRSMAFVAQNNDILMRRKGENVSPSYAYRSPSPTYRNSPPCRWSKSPSPPPKLGRSPGPRNRPHHYSSHRRSTSRSPPPSRPRSPPVRRRTVSRSPPPHPGQHASRHQSPNPFNRYPSRSPPPHNRRVKSRSPPAHTAKHKMSPPRRHMSRSPLPHIERPSSRSPPPLNGRRSPIASLRYVNRNRRSLSPPHNRKRSPVGNLDAGEMPSRHIFNRDRRSPPLPTIHRRSASPLPASARQRSHSRSPHRRYGRKSRERNVNAPPQRRRSPYANNRRRYEAAGSNGLRNNIRGRKRSGSPVIKDRPIRRSRTRSPDRNRRLNKRPRRVDQADRRGADDYYRNDSKRSDDRRSNPVQNQPQARKDRDEEMPKQKETSPCVTPTESSVASEDKQIKEPESSTGKETPEQENNTPEPASTNMEVEKEEASSDEEEEDDEDGIDLFASEDSESENEGRFKSSTSKNERTTQAATLSFTKLGESRPVEVKELTDVDPSHNRERDRDRSHNNYGRSRGNGSHNFRDGNRNGRDQDRRNKNNLNNKNRRDRDRERERIDRDWDSPLNRAGEEKKVEGGRIGAATVDRPMFKSTFQALETEGRSSRKNSRERETTDRKISSNSRRRNPSKDRKASPNNDLDYASNHLSTKGAVSTSKPASLPSSPSRGTKPIHLRLGAKTNTFKTAKKSSSSAWSSSSGNGNTEKEHKFPTKH